jgi:hypothetical protein
VAKSTWFFMLLRCASISSISPAHPADLDLHGQNLGELPGALGLKVDQPLLGMLGVG